MKIDEAERTVSWGIKASIRVGHNECYVCGLLTPAPTDEELIRVCRAKLTGNDNREAMEFSLGYVWPGEHSWWPRGWRMILDAGPGSDENLMCPGCAERVAGFIADLMKQHETKPARKRK